MRVMVFEPISSGHRFAYLAHLLPAIARLGATPVLVTSKEAFRSTAFSKHLDRYSSQFEVDDWFDLPADKNASKLANCFEGSFERVVPDHCFLPVGDGISQVLGARRLLGRRSKAEEIETESLLFRGRFGYPMRLGRARVKRFASRVTIGNAPWYRIFHLDPLQLSALCRGNAELAKRAFVMPDPVEQPPLLKKSEARKLLGIPGDGRYVGCAGNINQRKGIGLLLTAFSRVIDQLEDTDRLLLAGPTDEAMRKLMKGDCRNLMDTGRVICLDRYLSVEEMAQSMISMDLICTPYPEHSGSSSIVIRAAVVERPVLAANVNWIDRTVQQFELGQSLNVHDPNAFGVGIVEGLAQSGNFTLNSEAQKFVKFHSGENFVATWLDRLREKMGLGPDENRVAWPV